MAARPTVLTIMLSRSMRKLAKATVATMTKSLTPVTYSRLGLASTTDGSFFRPASGWSASTELENAALGDEGLPLDGRSVAIMEAVVSCDDQEVMSGR